MGQIGVLEAPENNHVGRVWLGEAVQKDDKQGEIVQLGGDSAEIVGEMQHIVKKE